MLMFYSVGRMAIIRLVGRIAMAIIRWVGCTTGFYHLRCLWTDEGIQCVDCGYFKDKAEHMADMHAGSGGWF